MKIIPSILFLLCTSFFLHSADNKSSVKRKPILAPLAISAPEESSRRSTVSHPAIIANPIPLQYPRQPRDREFFPEPARRKIAIISLTDTPKHLQKPKPALRTTSPRASDSDHNEEYLWINATGIIESMRFAPYSAGDLLYL